MAIEIAALLGAARVAAGLVQDVHGLVGNIRSGMLAKNDDAKRQLDEKLVALQQSLRDAARLAEFGEEYAGVQQDGVEPLFRALDDRIAWLNDKDKGQIQQRLQSAALAVDGAAQAVRSKASADADMHLRRIVDELRRVQSALNDTLRKGIFGSLEELAR